MVAPFNGGDDLVFGRMASRRMAHFLDPAKIDRLADEIERVRYGLVVESPTGAFQPFVVHYAETFIVPAAVGTYPLRPYGESAGRQCATVKAFVRT